MYCAQSIIVQNYANNGDDNIMNFIKLRRDTIKQLKKTITLTQISDTDLNKYMRQLELVFLKAIYTKYIIGDCQVATYSSAKYEELCYEPRLRHICILIFTYMIHLTLKTIRIDYDIEIRALVRYSLSPDEQKLIDDFY